MSKCVYGNFLSYLCFFYRVTENCLDASLRQMFSPLSAFKQVFLRLVLPVVHSQLLQHHIGEQGITVFLTFCSSKMDELPLAVDILNLQSYRFTYA